MDGLRFQLPFFLTMVCYVHIMLYAKNFQRASEIDGRFRTKCSPNQQTYTDFIKHLPNKQKATDIETSTTQ